MHLDLSGLAICGPREILFTHDEGRKEFHCTFNPVRCALLRPRSICLMAQFCRMPPMQQLIPTATRQRGNELISPSKPDKTKRASVSNFIMIRVVPHLKFSMAQLFLAPSCQTISSVPCRVRLSESSKRVLNHG